MRQVLQPDPNLSSSSNMQQSCMPVGIADPEIQEVGRQEQEGAGNGGSRNWMQEVKLKIEQDAKGVPLSSGATPYFRRFDQTNDDNELRPSIFRPRCQVAVAVAAPAAVSTQTPPQQPTSSRGSTGGNVLVAAVGPYHPETWQSRPPIIARAKKCAIVEFLDRPEFGLDSAGFLAWARDNDAHARGCYEPYSFTMSPKELAEMHLLDGCLVLFAIFLLKKSSAGEDQLATESCPEPARTSGHWKRSQDFINRSADITRHMKQTRLDLLLVGNQIPFFVLQELHSRLKGTFFSGIKRSIQELALSCFDDIRPFAATGFIKQKQVVVDGGKAVSFPQPVHHLLHLFHWSRVAQGNQDDSPPLLGEPESNLPCATWFEDSRIGFSTQADAASPGELQMVFRRSMLGARGVLRVPALHIHGYSALVYHNLIAFEQSHLRCGVSATTYCVCMARLLQSEDDAKLLRRSGILAHTHETDEEIIALFRGLAQEYRHASYYSKDLLDLCKDVEAHHRSLANRAARLVVQCFPCQTLTIFIVLAVLVSVATLINTGFSLYRFFHPVKK